METPTDSKSAQMLLDCRRDGLKATQWRQLKANPGRWIAFIAILAALLTISIFLRSWIFTALIVGYIFGVLSSYESWIKQGRLVWAFYLKIIDWTKVEELAVGKTQGD